MSAEKQALLMPDDPADSLVALQVLSSSDIVAFDLEFDREQFTYGFTLCLMQLATPERVVIVDPFKDDVLKPFLQFLQHSSCTKLVHSSGEDIRLLHHLNCFPPQVEDTEIYARWLNHENTSLSFLLQDYCGVTLDKDQQRSNWTLRPLSAKQIEYAQQDVLYLFQLRDRLREATERKGLMPYALEDIAIQGRWRFDEKPAYPFVKPADYHRYSAYELHVLNGMMALRDSIAAKINKPLHFVAPEKLMKEAVLEQNDLNVLFGHHAVHAAAKRKEVVEKWRERYKQLHQEANDLQLSKQLNGKYNGMAYTQQQFFEKQVFNPIQKQLEKQFGTFTARYILSNRTVGAILKGDLTLTQLEHPLKLRLIQDAAQQQKVDVSAWL